MNTNPMLLIDFYKACHSDMLPKGIIKSVSYFTPRMSRVDRWKEVVHFGLQGFIKTYLIDYFNKEFFNKTKEEVVEKWNEFYLNKIALLEEEIKKQKDLFFSYKLFPKIKNFYRIITKFRS